MPSKHQMLHRLLQCYRQKRQFEDIIVLIEYFLMLIITLYNESTYYFDTYSGRAGSRHCRARYVDALPTKRALPFSAIALLFLPTVPPRFDYDTPLVIIGLLLHYS
jgi:hypothetical protein